MFYNNLDQVKRNFKKCLMKSNFMKQSQYTDVVQVYKACIIHK